ncbi:MAG: cell division topological specificity factor MinE [Gammaproteobacteria bacterium]|nr:cell division topological specificity factor MinE [Gammaproteobacteria bacterium]
MSILDIFKSPKKTSANIAKDRLLQLIVDEGIHSRINKLDLVKLQEELIEVISRYLPIKAHEVTVEVERDDNRSILELNVILPEDI